MSDLTTEYEPVITAISTPPGTGGIAVIRLSGAGALKIVQRIFTPRTGSIDFTHFPVQKALFGDLHDTQGKLLDEVIVVYFKSPHSYTCEDLVEISCHGGLVNTRQILELILAQGARLADAGEFTRRAFLNGRIDLTQAEAVADLIHAKTQRASHVAATQLQGTLTRQIVRVRDELMNALAHVEAHIDFPDEDISPQTRDKLRTNLQQALDFSNELVKKSHHGRILREGIRTVITGEPNVGKSSLFNSLLGADRAIITPVAGTTRDTLEEILSIDGIPLVLIDTAGIRHTDDLIEVEGIKRSEYARSQAELILEILDISQPPASPHCEDHRILRVWNKADLMPSLSPSQIAPDEVLVSAVTGQGIESLKKAVLEKIGFEEIKSDSEVFLINTRQRNALDKAATALKDCLDTIQSARPLELVALDLRRACQSLGEIVGKTSTEDLLDKIFSSFCIGK